MENGNRTAIVTGASGQDGWFLVRDLCEEGFTVYALTRRPAVFEGCSAGRGEVRVVEADLRDPTTICTLLAEVRPDEFYNLAGASSVAQSFANPRATWEVNAHAVVQLLDTLRRNARSTRFYQASSGEMFGFVPGGAVVHDESSALAPQSPYAASKAAAHLFCHSYREAYGLRIASGILFNHESSRRGSAFLTRKVVDHVTALRAGAASAPLSVGNLKAQRDWGFAPDYVRGMRLVLRQIDRRAEHLGRPHEEDVGGNYRDYVLGSGALHYVWELVDRAFALAGYELEWFLDGADPTAWHATFADTGASAVRVDASLLRPSDPLAIKADASLAAAELGWRPRGALDGFLEEMLAAATIAVA